MNTKKGAVAGAIAVLALALGVGLLFPDGQAGASPEKIVSQEKIVASLKTWEQEWKEVQKITYSDVVDGMDAQSAVQYLTYHGIMQGTGESRFSPDRLSTRGAAGAVLYRLYTSDLLGESGGEPTEDITPLVWANETGIIQGDSDGNLREGATITRGQWATFLYRFAQHMDWNTACSGDLAEYPDSRTVPEYARLPLSWALETGVFNGMIQDGIQPHIAVSRAQLAKSLTALIALGTEDALAVQLAPEPTERKTSMSRANHEAIQAKVDAAAKKYGAIGLQVAVIEDGVVTDTYAYGWATIEQSKEKKITTPMTADHKMRIASISKVVVGMDAMLLRERGLVNLDASIGDYWGVPIRNPYYSDKPVSITSILSHTSSIIMAGDNTSRAYSAVKNHLGSGAGFSKLVPGSIYSWGYNNYAFSVLGMTLELAANQTMDEMLNQYLFNAMNIDGAFCSGDVNQTSLLTTLYYHDGSVSRSIEKQKEIHAKEPGSTGTYFAGGLTISARDMGKLVALLANDGNYEGLQLMKPESVAMMEKQNKYLLPGDFYQALPLRYQDSMYGRSGLYYHTGSAYGVYNCMSYDPVEKDGVVVLSVGASAERDAEGIYAVCGNISETIYEIIKN